MEVDQRFISIYRKYLKDIYTYCYYHTGNHYDAEDLAEQTFLRAYTHLEDAVKKSRGRSLKPWLIRIAHNLVSNFKRDRYRRSEMSLENAPPPETVRSTDRVVVAREDLTAAIESLKRLSPDRRNVLIMRFALGMSVKETAEAIGRSVPATKVLLHRATKELKQLVS